MMPFSQMDENIDRRLENLEKGEPEEGDSAALGGIGATSEDLTQAEEALKQEGALDETVAEETKDD